MAKRAVYSKPYNIQRIDNQLHAKLSIQAMISFVEFSWMLEKANPDSSNLLIFSLPSLLKPKQLQKPKINLPPLETIPSIYLIADISVSFSNFRLSPTLKYTKSYL